MNAGKDAIKVSPRTVTTRRVAFAYPETDLPRHYVNGDPVMSAVVSVLSALFPEGEDFFVRSVRSYRDEVTDPELKRQVAGFIGQEAMHGREHRRFNERLASLGFPTRAIERTLRWGFKASERLPGRSRRLAVTAALEHYTATLAEVLLTDPRAQATLHIDEVRNLFLWHALEESEHKAVAFDVFGAVCGKHRMRRWVMNATTLGFFAGVIFWTGLSLLLDGATWRHPVCVLRSLAGLRRSPWVSRAIWRRLRDYNRRGFHPDDWDATELTAKWREELFGAHGSLTARLATPTATA
jgi:predicted metal-dependent hydrolase